MRGRVSAVNSMFIGTSNQLGEFESGLTASWFGTVPAVLIGGIGTLAVVALWIRLFPELARADRIGPAEESSAPRPDRERSRLVGMSPASPRIGTVPLEPVAEGRRQAEELQLDPLRLAPGGLARDEAHEALVLVHGRLELVPDGLGELSPAMAFLSASLPRGLLPQT